MSYVDQARLARDAGFLDQVRTALMSAAVAIEGEAQGAVTAAVLDKRQQLATAILAGVDGYVSRFAWAVAASAGLSLGSPVSIASSTNANPTVTTTTGAHGLAVGDVVEVAGHLVNTALNGAWTVTVVGSTTTFTVAVAGSGVGTASGTVVKLPSDTVVQNAVNGIFNDVAGVRVTD